MTYKEIDNMIESIGLPYAYYEFKDGTGIAPPFLCFFYPDSADFMADNTNYQIIRPLTIELYTDNKDFALEALVENALASADLPFSRTEEYIDAERMFQITYDTEVVING